VASTTLLLWIVLSEVGFLLSLLLLFFGHGAWLWWQARRQHILLEKARSLLSVMLETGHFQNTDLHWFRSLPFAIQESLFLDIAPTLSGVYKKQLANLAHEIDLVARAEASCRSRWWWRRLRGVRLLTLLEEGMEVVPPLFHDRNPFVRAQVAEWATAHPTPLVIDCLLRTLDDAHGLVRFVAQESLSRMGKDAVEPLLRLLSSATGQQLEAALTIAVRLAIPRFLEPALLLCRHDSLRIRQLAVTLLGVVGGQSVGSILVGLLGDSAPEVRAAAAHALGKLNQWTAASRLASLLCDHAWIVRQEAGLALRSLGAPGLLFLRRALSSENHFAADMACQILDLPDTRTSVVAA
jgi:hypothetical protein